MTPSNIVDFVLVGAQLDLLMKRTFQKARGDTLLKFNPSLGGNSKAMSFII